MRTHAKLVVLIRETEAAIAEEHETGALNLLVAKHAVYEAALAALGPDDDAAPLAKKPAPVAPVPRESEAERLDRLNRVSGLPKPKPKPVIAARPVHVIEPESARARMLAADAARLAVPLSERLGFAATTRAEYTQSDEWTVRCPDAECAAMNPPDAKACRLCGGTMQGGEDLSAFAASVARASGAR